MAYNDLFRLSAHGVFTNADGHVLQLKTTYADFRWGLPGGALEPGETVHEALLRECREELGLDIKILYMSGIYYHHSHNSQVCIFRCEMPSDSKIILSSEHSELKYFALNELIEVQRQRIQDCLDFNGYVKSAKF